VGNVMVHFVDNS